MYIQPPLSKFISVPDAVHKQWITTLKEGKILYLSGMFGYGKTAQTIHFAKTYFLDWTYISVNQDDFLQKTDDFISKFQKKTGKTLLILDDLQWLTEHNEQQRLFNLLVHQTQFGSKLQVMLLSRGNLPEFLVPLRITQRLAIADRNSLILQQSQLLELLTAQKELAHYTPKKRSDLAAHCFELTSGCAALVQIYLHHLFEHPEDAATAGTLATRDVYYYLDSQLFHKWDEEDLHALYRLGVCTSFTTDLAKLLLDEDAQDFLRRTMYLDGFLKYEAPDTYHFHFTFAWYFSVKLSKMEEQVRNEVYETTAKYYEECRQFQEALRCYKLANCTDRIVELVIYLLENADGCVFAQLSEKYMDLLTPELEEKDPRIIGAKAMLAAYRMEPETSREYLQKLKVLAENRQKKGADTTALSVYVRTLIAIPCVDSTELKENLLLCSQYVQKNGVALENIMPTSNSASLLNGGIDLLFWVPYKDVLFPLMKKTILTVLGKEGVGAPDACLGEVLYEQNKSVQAMASLTQGLSDSNFKGSIRIQYAITGIMARLLQSDGQLEASREILTTIYEKATQQKFIELLPNIVGSLIQCALLHQDTETYTRWLNENAPSEHATFYITSRYVLLTKARVYIAIGRELEALHIVNFLQNYAVLYHRHYMQIELMILKAIISFRREDDWQSILIEAVQKAEPYQIIRVFADQGVALLPLWKALDWKKETKISTRYVNAIEKELTVMANHYPKYLQVPRAFGALTEREREVLKLVARGDSNTQISQKLDINLGTAKFHVSNIIKKLKAENRTEAVKIAQEQRLI